MSPPISIRPSAPTFYNLLQLELENFILFERSFGNHLSVVEKIIPLNHLIEINVTIKNQFNRIVAYFAKLSSLDRQEPNRSFIILNLLYQLNAIDLDDFEFAICELRQDILLEV